MLTFARWLVISLAFWYELMFLWVSGRCIIMLNTPSVLEHTVLVMKLRACPLEKNHSFILLQLGTRMGQIAFFFD